jgi:hypothetical protein
MKEGGKRVEAVEGICYGAVLSTGIPCFLMSTEVAPVLISHLQFPPFSLKIVGCFSVFLSV